MKTCDGHRQKQRHVRTRQMSMPMCYQETEDMHNGTPKAGWYVQGRYHVGVRGEEEEERRALRALWGSPGRSIVPVGIFRMLLWVDIVIMLVLKIVS